MPTVKNWINLTYVTLAFLLYMVGTQYFISLQEIKANWPLYRCNPMYMPLSDDINKDFVTCIQNTQTNFMGYLLEPLTFITSALTDSMAGMMGELNSVRGMFDQMRSFSGLNIQSIFGVFMNLMIEFQKIIIGMRDLIGKTIGVVVTMLYMLDGSLKTMGSAWNGPDGQLVRALSGCFHPETKMRLKNGSVVCMKDLNLGDVLENSSVVDATMRINNNPKKEDMYIIKNGGVDGEDIYVTGSHLINSGGSFIPVKKYAPAVKTDMYCEWFSCLITSDNKIQIGRTEFWDWEDHFIR